MMTELPSISTTGTTSSSYTWSNTGATFVSDVAQDKPRRILQTSDYLKTTPVETIKESKTEPMSNRRIVQVYIADPDEDVPLEKALLYQDEKPHITDLTDQELFFDIDIKSILEKHNAFRITLIDKEASEGKNNDVKLEKAKIRDLKMTVVVVAQF